MSWTNALYLFLIDAFRPPFRTSHWVALAYLVLSVIYNPGSHFNHWVLTDTDDYIRFVQVFNWLDGQSWTDLSLPRLYPNHVISMHWARLVDIPLAGLLLALKALATFFQWQTERQGLAMLAAFLVPCVLLACMLLLMRAIARPLLGRRYAGLACFFVPLSVQPVFQFTPMRVDHHAYIILFATLAFLCLQRIALNIRPLRHALCAGLSLALGMWNGAEIMPVVAAFSACLSIILVIRTNGQRKWAGFVFGASLLLSCAAILPLAVPPQARTLMLYDSYSAFYVVLALYAFVFFAVLTALVFLCRVRAVNLAALLLVALLLLADVLTRFPDFIGGPYAQANPLLLHLFFPNIREAVPLFKSLGDLKDGFGDAPTQSIAGAVYFLATRLFGPVIALFTTLALLLRRRTPARARLLWLVFAVFSILFLGLGVFWQVRVMSYAQLFAIVPVTWLMLRYLATLPRHYSGRTLFGWEVLTVLCFTILPTVVVPSIILKSKMNPDMMFFLGSGAGNISCSDTSTVISWLNGIEQDEKKTSVIMSHLDYGPPLLFGTHHSVIAAPYHRNDRGIIDMAMFFRSRGDDTPARRIAARDHVDYVLICKKYYSSGTLDGRREARKIVVNVGEKGNVTTRPPEDEIISSSLGFRLTYDMVPPWLELVDIPFEKEFALYRVRRDRLDKPTTYPKAEKKG